MCAVSQHNSMHITEQDYLKIALIKNSKTPTGLNQDYEKTVISTVIQKFSFMPSSYRIFPALEAVCI